MTDKTKDEFCYLGLARKWIQRYKDDDAEPELVIIQIMPVIEFALYLDSRLTKRAADVGDRPAKPAAD